jgi:hypothetical protein
MLPLDPFNRSSLPAEFSRRTRVRLLREVADALLRGERPSMEAGLFVAGAVSAWLSEGGSLERDYLKVSAPKGSHDTAQALAAELARFDSPTDEDEA